MPRYQLGLLILLMALTACGSGGLADCEVVPPGTEGIEAWKVQMEQVVSRVELRYPFELDFIESRSLAYRRAAAYRATYPEIVSGLPGPLRGLRLVGARGTQTERDHAAAEFARCTGLELFANNVRTDGFSEYYFARGSYNGPQLAWLVDWGLAHFPGDLIHGSHWTDHDQGFGGSL